MLAGLSIGRFPDPHLGECTQDGHPDSQGQFSMTSNVQFNSLEADDYRLPAELAVRQVVETTSRYAEPERYRAEIESSAAETGHA